MTKREHLKHIGAQLKILQRGADLDDLIYRAELDLQAWHKKLDWIKAEGHSPTYYERRIAEETAKQDALKAERRQLMADNADLFSPTKSL